MTDVSIKVMGILGLHCSLALVGLFGTIDRVGRTCAESFGLKDNVYSVFFMYKTVDSCPLRDDVLCLTPSYTVILSVLMEVCVCVCVCVYVFSGITGYKALPDASIVKNPPATAGDVDLIPGSGRSPE